MKRLFLILCIFMFVGCPSVSQVHTRDYSSTCQMERNFINAIGDFLDETAILLPNDEESRNVIGALRISLSLGYEAFDYCEMDQDNKAFLQWIPSILNALQAIIVFLDSAGVEVPSLIVPILDMLESFLRGLYDGKGYMEKLQELERLWIH